MGTIKVLHYVTIYGGSRVLRSVVYRTEDCDKSNVEESDSMPFKSHGEDGVCAS